MKHPVSVAHYGKDGAVQRTFARDDLKTMQSLVGGYIEAVALADPRFTLFCNEEGKLEGLPCHHAAMLYGGPADPIAGDFFVCRMDDANIASLQPGDLDLLALLLIPKP